MCNGDSPAQEIDVEPSKSKQFPSSDSCQRQSDKRRPINGIDGRENRFCLLDREAWFLFTFVLGTMDFGANRVCPHKPIFSGNVEHELEKVVNVPLIFCRQFLRLQLTHEIPNFERLDIVQHSFLEEGKDPFSNNTVPGVACRLLDILRIKVMLPDRACNIIESSQFPGGDSPV